MQTDLLYKPAIPLLGIFLKGSRTACHRDAWKSTFTATLFVMLEGPPTGMDKENVVGISDGTFFSHEQGDGVICRRLCAPRECHTLCTEPRSFFSTNTHNVHVYGMRMKTD